MAARKKPKQYFYVCVVAKDNKFAFVTKIDSEKKTAEWTMKEGDKPLTIYSWDDANYIALVKTALFVLPVKFAPRKPLHLWRYRFQTKESISINTGSVTTYQGIIFAIQQFRI